MILNVPQTPRSMSIFFESAWRNAKTHAVSGTRLTNSAFGMRLPTLGANDTETATVYPCEGSNPSALTNLVRHSGRLDALNNTPANSLSLLDCAPASLSRVEQPLLSGGCCRGKQIATVTGQHPAPSPLVVNQN